MSWSLLKKVTWFGLKRILSLKIIWCPSHNNLQLNQNVFVKKNKPSSGMNKKTSLALQSFEVLLLRMMSSQMAPMAVWVCADLRPFCLLHLALATKWMWDMKSSVVVAPLQHSLMYKDSRDSQAPGKEKNKMSHSIPQTNETSIVEHDPRLMCSSKEKRD